jgi:thioredoxin-related protein
VLSGDGLVQKYHVRDFPTLVVIDQRGKIADVQIGYSPALREDLSTTLKSLLRGKQQGGSGEGRPPGGPER